MFNDLAYTCTSMMAVSCPSLTRTNKHESWCCTGCLSLGHSLRHEYEGMVDISSMKDD